MAANLKSNGFVFLKKTHNQISLPKAPSQLRASSIKRFNLMAALTTVPTVRLSENKVERTGQGNFFSLCSLYLNVCVFKFFMDEIVRQLFEEIPHRESSDIYLNSISN